MSPTTITDKREVIIKGASNPSFTSGGQERYLN